MEVTELTWADRIDLRSSLRTRREDIRKLIQVRFGQVPSEVEAMINGTDSEEELEAFFERAIVAQTEGDLL